MKRPMPSYIIPLLMWMHVISALFIFTDHEVRASQTQEDNELNMANQVKDEHVIISKSAAMAVNMLSGYSGVTNNTLRVRCAKHKDNYNIVFFAFDGSNEAGIPLAEVEIFWRKLSYNSFAVSEVRITSASTPLHPAMLNANTNESLDLPIVAAVNLLGHSGSLSYEFILEWHKRRQGAIDVIVTHYPFAPGRHTIVSVNRQGITISFGR